jgi:Rad3-related DNA helicase
VHYCTDTYVIAISVDELCALAHRGGNLDTRFPQRSPRAVKHINFDKLKLPKQQGMRRGVLLRNTLSHAGIPYTVEGVADGIVASENLVEEIKISKKSAVPVREDAYSRLRCLAYFYAVSNGLSRVKMRMRLYHTDTDTVQDMYSEANTDELGLFYLSLLSRIEPLARDLLRREEERLPSISRLRFPYPNPREGQTELAESVFRTIRRGERLFAQAPTGIGKTMSTLYPAVKALGEGLCDRIFYLTAKSSVRREAYAAAGMLHEAGARLRAIMLYAKEQMCSHPEGCHNGAFSRCNPKDCPMAKGYFDRSGEAVAEALATRHGYPKSFITEVAERHRVCPYELSLDISEHCEIIICDYNYVFSPDVYLRRYFDAEEGERGRYVFLVDEAHNLPDRARDMYSVSLASAPFREVYACIDPADTELEGELGGFLMSLERLGTLCTENHQKHEDGTQSGYYINRAPLENFAGLVARLRQHLDAFIKKNPDHPLFDRLAELTALLRRFSNLSDYYDDRFLTYVQLCCGELSVQLICLDPAGVLGSALGRACASVLFSATLSPLEYFADIMGGGKRARTLDLPSPYDPARLCVAVVPGISTRMEDRKASYRKVATMIAATISARAGNYMVYFPSYDYMERVVEQFETRYGKVPHIV